MSEIINWIIEDKQAMLIFFGSFLGAFFAFCFFVVGEIIIEKWKRRKDWKKTYLNEHAYLERYFNYLFIVINKNIIFYKGIENNFNKKRTTVTNLCKLPVREDISMRLNDVEYFNKVESCITELKTLNDDIETFNNHKNKIVSNIEKLVFKQQRENLEKVIDYDVKFFIEESKVILNFQEMLKDKIIDLAIENRFLIKQYKTQWFNKIKNKFDKDFRTKRIEKNKE